jgi:glutamate/tyrosine decarboxylase-like PLP-dependent enzyme
VADTTGADDEAGTARPAPAIRPPADPLALEPDVMRAMGYRVVDMLVDRIVRLPSEPALRMASRAEMEARIAEPPPEHGRDFATLLARLDEDVLPFVGHFDHPRFFGYVPGAGTWPGALGDLIAAATNIDAGAWREAAGPIQLELTVVDWFREWIGYPAEGAGVLVSGGSAANLTALACAREALIGPMSPQIVAYASDQSHSSVARAARLLGFRPDQIRVLPADANLRIRPADLVAAMDSDLAAGRLPFFVCANAGATNTGAIDDLRGLAEICRERNVWLHVDAAYGGFAVLTERGRALLAGIELADSVTLDPHKWLAMPFEVGCLMVRRGEALERAFELHPEYLRERPDGPGSVNFADRGLQLTRASRAIKVWLALQTFGVDAFRAAIDRAMDLTLFAQRRIEADARLELVTPASLGVLTFRRRGAADATHREIDRANERLVAWLANRGDVLLTSTMIGGRYVIRLCVLNHTTGQADVIEALDQVAEADTGDTTSEPLASGSVAGSSGRDSGIDVSWLRAHGFDADRLRAVEAFATVTDEQASRFLGTGREESYDPGDAVTERWAYARVFYLVLEGRLSVRIDAAEVNALGPGDYLGEIAAIDWGRDFSYGRTATVVATEPSRVLALPAAALRALMGEAPEVDRAIRTTAATRLRTR